MFSCRAVKLQGDHKVFVTDILEGVWRHGGDSLNVSFGHPNNKSCVTNVAAATAVKLLEKQA